MRTTIGCLFLLCFYTFLYAQPERNVDSLTHLLSTLSVDTPKIAVYTQLTEALQSVNTDRAVVTGEEGLRLAEVIGDPNRLAYMNVALGRAYANSGNVNRAYRHFVRADSLFATIPSNTGRSAALQKLLFALMKRGDYEAVSRTAFELIDLERGLDQPFVRAEAYLYIGYAARATEQYPTAIEYFTKGYEVHASEQNRAGMSLALEALAHVQMLVGKPSDAYRDANRAVEIVRQTEQEAALPSPLYVRAQTLKALGRYEEALRDYQRAYELAQRFGYTAFALGIGADMGELFLQQDRPAAALPYLHASRAWEARNGMDDNAQESYRRLAEAHRQLGNTDSVVHFKNLEIERLRAVYNTESAETIRELRTRYETAEKETRIAEQNATLEQQAARQRLILVAVLLLVLVLAALFYAFRNKQRSNRLLKEKNDRISLLLREVHHRVKNNLQTVSGLLSLQSRETDDPSVLAAVRESRARVQSMSMIHARLYGEDGVASIEMSDYLRELATVVSESYASQTTTVRIDVADTPLEMDVDLAIPIGLVVNELLTNAFKYAFVGRTEGRIDIRLRHHSAGYYLRFADDGIGTSAATGRKGFGTRLIDLLVRQLEGQKTATNKNGTIIEITFADKNYGA